MFEKYFSYILSWDMGTNLLLQDYFHSVESYSISACLVIIREKGYLNAFLKPTETNNNEITSSYYRNISTLLDNPGNIVLAIPRKS